MSITRALGLVLVALPLLPAACGDDSGDGDGNGAPKDPEGRGTELVGQTCKSASECFGGIVDGGALRGEAVCLDRVTDGYCTHQCAADTDCCAVPGECRTDLPQVCSPFESTGQKLCLLSCEEDDIRAHERELFADAGAIDATLFCQRRAGADFGCRSSGGGRENRKVCMPVGGNDLDAGGD